MNKETLKEHLSVETTVSRESEYFGPPYKYYSDCKSKLRRRRAQRML